MILYFSVLFLLVNLTLAEENCNVLDNVNIGELKSYSVSGTNFAVKLLELVPENHVVLEINKGEFKSTVNMGDISRFSTTDSDIVISTKTIGENGATLCMSIELHLDDSVTECNEAWSCGSWSVCLEEGVQLRSCKDANNCNTELKKPITSNICDPDASKKCKENEERKCETNKVGICKLGTQTCKSGIWADCKSINNPTSEVCDDRLDNDCDGKVDENCATNNTGCYFIERDDSYCEKEYCTIAILVKKDLYDKIAPELERFKTDIEKDYSKFKVTIDKFSDDATSKQIKNKLKEIYVSDNLMGAILIGDLPHSVFISEGVEGVFTGQGDLISDAYYIDLLDTCPYDEEQDAYIRNKDCLKFLPPIWVSRILPPDNNLQMLKDYFDKNHDYRTGKIIFKDEMLMYIPQYNDNPADKDRLLNEQIDMIVSLGIYDQSKIKIANSDVGERDEYLSEIKENYQFVYLNAHGDPTSHQYDIHSKDILSNAMIVYPNACSVGRFTDDDYIAGKYLFNGNTLFISAGSIPLQVPSSTNRWNLLRLLKDGRPIFYAYQQMSGNLNPAVNWLGDPTLRMISVSSSTENPSQRLCFSKNSIDFGNLESEKSRYEELVIFNKGTVAVSIIPPVIQITDIHSDYLPSIEYMFAGENNILPGKNLTIYLQLNAENGDASGKLFFFTNSKNDNSIEIPFAEGKTISDDNCPPYPGDDFCPGGKDFIIAAEGKNGCMMWTCKPHINNSENCNNGCMHNNKCIPLGMRDADKYCGLNGKMTIQLNSDETCNNNFECQSNLCIDDKCINQNLIQKIIAWFKRIFG